MQREAFPMIDELDVLQKELENKNYSNHVNRLAKEAENNNMNPEFKAQHLSAMRKFIEEKGHPENPLPYDNRPDPFDFTKPSSSRSEEVKEGGGPDEIDRAMYELESVRSA